MEPGREVEAPTTDDPTPLPLRVDELGGAVASAPPHAPDTPGAVLVAIATAGGTWFPSRYASEVGIGRDRLDDPLAELRLAGLVRVAEWVRGVGQGYALTAEGQAVAADPVAVERLRQPSAAVPLLPPPPPAPGDEPEPAYAGGEPVVNPPVVVPALLVANALWFFVCAVYSIRWGLTPARALSEGHYEVLQRFGAVSGEWLLAGEWWRLITSCFVHIGALHLLGNLFALAMMGPLAELLWGRGRLLLIYFVSGLAGSALAMALRPDSILAGASGAIWGIQMSLFAWLFAYRDRLPRAVADDWFRRLMVVFVLNAGVSFLPSVSWEGHLGGGAAGFAAAWLLNATRSGSRTRRACAWLLLAALPVLCVGGLIAAMDAKGIPKWQRLRLQLAAQKEATAGAERRQKLRDAETAYRLRVVPKLVELNPVLIAARQLEAGELAARAKRPPARVEEVKGRIRALRAAAEEAHKHVPAPIGDDATDQVLARARAAAAARMKSFDLLLGLLDGPAPPPDDAWDAWQAAKHDADRLWAEWHAR